MLHLIYRTAESAEDNLPMCKIEGVCFHVFLTLMFLCAMFLLSLTTTKKLVCITNRKKEELCVASAPHLRLPYMQVMLWPVESVVPGL